MGLPQAVLDQEAKADDLIKEQEKPKEENVVIDIDPEILKEDPNKDLPDEFKQDEPAKIIKEAPPRDATQEALDTERRLNKSLDNENRSLKIKIVKLEKENIELKAKITEAQTVKPESTKFTQEERQVFVDEGFAPELIDIFEKKNIVPQTVNPEVQTLKDELNTVKEVTAQTNAEVFQSNLDRACPGWRVKNDEPAFVDSLQEYPPYSSLTKHQILQEAYNKQDLNVVAQIFNDYKPEGKTKDVKKLEDLAEPKSASAPPPDIKGQSAQWTPAQVSQFYNDLVKDPTKYTAEQVAAIEKAYIHP